MNPKQTITLYLGLVTRDGVPILGPRTLDQVVSAVADLLGRQGIDAFTTVRGTGCWNGVLEPCLLIQVSSDQNPRTLALRLAQEFNQEAVAFSVTPPLELVHNYG